MKAKSIRLKGFKRFTDLTIDDIPATTKLVLVVGPNGSGKSSLFDAFIHWHRNRAGWGIDQDRLFYQKGDETSFDWGNTVQIEVHESKVVQKSSLYMRTAYRNDPDFTMNGLNRLGSGPIDVSVAI